MIGHNFNLFLCTNISCYRVREFLAELFHCLKIYERKKTKYSETCLNRTSQCSQQTGVWLIEVKLTKISYIGTLFKVPFIQDCGLLRVWFIQDSGLFRVLFRQVSGLFRVWFIQDCGLLRVWFIQDSGLLRVWFRQVSGLLSPRQRSCEGIQKRYRPSFRNILVNTLESTSFNGFLPNLVHTQS